MATVVHVVSPGRPENGSEYLTRMAAQYDAQSQSPSRATVETRAAPVAHLPTSAGSPEYLARMLAAGDPSYRAEVAPSAAPSAAPGPATTSAEGGPRGDPEDADGQGETTTDPLDAEVSVVLEEYASRGELTDDTVARIQQHEPNATPEQIREAVAFVAKVKSWGLGR